MKPLMVGKMYKVRGRTVETRSRLVVAEAEMVDEFSNVFAKARGKVMPFSDAQMEAFHAASK